MSQLSGKLSYTEKGMKEAVDCKCGKWMSKVLLHMMYGRSCGWAQEQVKLQEIPKNIAPAGGVGGSRSVWDAGFSTEPAHP